MYNSSIKGQSQHASYEKHDTIPNKVIYNDMSKNHMLDSFKSCDVIYSEIAWAYGYSIFNDRAGNAPNEYSEYLCNINRCIEELGIPAFIVCGKPAKRHFKQASMYEITITTSGTKMNKCTLYVWNSEFDERIITTSALLESLAGKYNKCLDFSCGYGEHLLQFKDFVACDVDLNCLTYLCERYKEAKNGKTKKEDRQETV